jgi:hypothetical protein
MISEPNAGSTEAAKEFFARPRQRPELVQSTREDPPMSKGTSMKKEKKKEKKKPKAKA